MINTNEETIKALAMKFQDKVTALFNEMFPEKTDLFVCIGNLGEDNLSAVTFGRGCPGCVAQFLAEEVLSGRIVHNNRQPDAFIPDVDPNETKH